MSIDHETNEALNALAVLDEATAERAIAAERAYSEAQDEWISDWIEENADDPDDDDERDSLHDFAQQTDEYKAFCDRARIDIAAEHGIEAEVLDHAIALMNDGDDALALLDHRRAELSAAHHLT
ncbi:ATP-dependent protease [Paraburkholderia tropica]|uniref:ATP-dependent protease n=1 Tax=Paraburkholderia tropica TaxID=92647 RepID=UPI001F397B64|nr:ATP-dependent protease [Paraburkholderia tropica]